MFHSNTLQITDDDINLKKPFHSFVRGHTKPLGQKYLSISLARAFSVMNCFCHSNKFIVCVFMNNKEAPALNSNYKEVVGLLSESPLIVKSH